MPVNDSRFSLSPISSEIIGIEKDLSLRVETNFDARAEAIDHIDFHILGRIDSLLQDQEPIVELFELKQRAVELISALKAVDDALFARLRENIRSGDHNPSSFKAMIAKYIRFDLNDAGRHNRVGYDNLDVFVDGLLSHQVAVEPTSGLEPEMVFLQKTPGRIIFELVEIAGLTKDDVFFDIGAGLGQAAILVNLLSGATAKGIEYEPAYCDHAINCASALNLPDVKFINIDARKADYSDGTVFFMYTPFKGQMLQDVLELLRNKSQKKVIRIFTYGPCSPGVGRQSWLSCENGPPDDLYKLYTFRSL